MGLNAKTAGKRKLRERLGNCFGGKLCRERENGRRIYGLKERGAGKETIKFRGYKRWAMINVLLLEDEAIIRNGILKHIPFTDLGITHIQTASNPIEGFRAVEKEKPDIIISDIRMPEMTGIEFVRRIREKHRELPVIMISGYADKEYLTSAIELGVLSYIEKPIDMDELVAALKKAVESIRRSRRHKKSLLNQLFKNSVTEEEFREYLNYNAYRLLLVYSKEELVHLSGIEEGLQQLFFEQGRNGVCIADKISAQYSVILLGTKEELSDEDCVNISAHIFSIKKGDEQIFLAIGEKLGMEDGAEGLKSSYKRSRNQIKNLSYKGWNQYSFAFEEGRELYIELSDGYFKDIGRYVAGGEYEKAIALVKRHRDDVIRRKALLNFSLRHSFYLIGKELKAVVENKEGAGEYIYKFLDEAATIDEMYEYIIGYIQEIREYRSCSRTSSNYQIKEVQQYIEDNLSKSELNIGELAEKVFLTKTYLSALFKKKTGVNISQYIIDKRMEKAMLLLKNPRLKQYEVAEMVGYDDAKYFAKLFKKKVGLPPSEYRENLP